MVDDTVSTCKIEYGQLIQLAMSVAKITGKAGPVALKLAYSTVACMERYLFRMWELV